MVLHSNRDAIELVCDKIGVVLLVLGVMHFLNLFVFNAAQTGPSGEVRRAAATAAHAGGLGRVLD